MAGACLVLAFKFNQLGEIGEGDSRAYLQQLAACIRQLDRKDQLNKAALCDAELQAFVWLEFSLHLEPQEAGPHLHRMLDSLGISVEEYFHDDGSRKGSKEIQPA